MIMIFTEMPYLKFGFQAMSNIVLRMAKLHRLPFMPIG